MRSKLNPFIVLLTVWSFAFIPARGSEFTVDAWIKASNTGNGDFFGSSVAISGDTMVIGAPMEDSAAQTIDGDQADNSATDAGAVYVLKRSGNTWVQQAYLKAYNAGAGDKFGHSVAINGDLIVVGAPLEDSDAHGPGGPGLNNNAANAGAAYVFRRENDVWTYEAYLKPHNTGADDQFGQSVAIYGNTVVVGAHGEDSDERVINGYGTNNLSASSGAAYVFVRQAPSVWTQQAYLKPANANGGDHFGFSMALDADTLVIGAVDEDSAAVGVNGDGEDNNAPGSGAVYVFVRSGTNWSQQAYLKASNTLPDTASGSQPGDQFGYSVGVSGNTIIVGARYEDSIVGVINEPQNNQFLRDSGAAYVFVRTGTAWTQQALLKARYPDSRDEFGFSVGISGDRIVVGASKENSDGTGVNGDETNNSGGYDGAAYVFHREGEFWIQEAYLKEGADLNIWEVFGYSVAVSDETVIVGASQDGRNAVGVNGESVTGTGVSTAFSGAAWVFDLSAPLLQLEHASTSLPRASGARLDMATINGQNPTANFTIRNIGNESLSAIGFTFSGPDASRFTVSTAIGGATTLEPGETATFTLLFTPDTTAIKTATLSIGSNDRRLSPFVLPLRGLNLFTGTDTDGDGLSDAAEFRLAGVGFDWEQSQPDLVNALLSNADIAGLFTASQLQALNVGSPLIARNPQTGTMKLTIGLRKATQLTNFVALPLAAPQATVSLTGELEVEIIPEDDAAFYRLESR